MPVKKLLITGSNGFLGSNLVQFFAQNKNFDVFSTSQRKLALHGAKNFYQGDLQDMGFVKDLFSEIKPDLVINTVSLVNVDLCEEQPSLAYDITVRTAENIARESKRCNSRLIYISTDHLFDGNKPFYTEEDHPGPINMYGKTKLQAENIIRHYVSESVIVRTNFFGWSPHGHAPTFGEWVYTNLQNENPMTLFTDYYFTPIEVTYLTESIETIINSDYSGILNVAGLEKCSKYEFGMALAEITGLKTDRITKAKVSEESFKVQRPKNLALSTEKFQNVFNKKLPGLRASLERFIETMPSTRQG